MASVDPQTVATALAARLATIAGLQEYAEEPAVPTTPCAFVVGIVPLPPREHWHTTDGSHKKNRWLVRLLVSKASEKNSQKRLYEFMAYSGAKSLWATLLADNTLGGVAAGSIPQVITDRRVWTYADVLYQGFDIEMDVWG